VLVGHQVALQKALGKQQQIQPRLVRLPGKVQDDPDRRVHVTENLRRLTHADPHRLNLPADRTDGPDLAGRTGYPNHDQVHGSAAPGVVPSAQLVLRAAIAAYLGRYRGQTRLHTESDLRIFLRWCAGQGLEPLAAVQVDIERYVRWLQDVRRFQPSTVPRRLSIVVGFYRVCVIDQPLPHPPAGYVRRPTVPADSSTLGLGHLQFEALITTAQLSPNPNGFALVALLGLLGLRIFEACAASINDLGEEHGHRVLRVRGKGGKVVLVPTTASRGQSDRPSRDCGSKRDSPRPTAARCLSRRVAA